MALQNCALNLNRTGRELQPHGTPDFPCAGYSSVYTDSAGDVVPWHWHEDLEIIYVESGHLRLQVPGKTFHLKQGEGAVINSNILHFAAAEPPLRTPLPGLSPSFGNRRKGFRIFQEVCGTAPSVQELRHLSI